MAGHEEDVRVGEVVGRRGPIELHASHARPRHSLLQPCERADASFGGTEPPVKRIRLVTVRARRLERRVDKLQGINGESGRSAVSSQLTGASSDEAASAEFGANEWLVDEMYEQYIVDKNSVDEAWWPVLETYHSQT
ncbi:MAG: hypothetical protein ABWY53_01325, partial [Leifsonia flava]